MEALRAKHRQEVSDLQTQPATDQANAVNAARAEVSEEMKKMRSQLVGKMEGLLSDLEAVRRSETDLKKEKCALQARVDDLEQQLAACKENLASAQASNEALRKASGTAGKAMEATLAEREASILSLQKRVTELETQLRATRDRTY